MDIPTLPPLYPLPEEDDSNIFVEHVPAILLTTQPSTHHGSAQVVTQIRAIYNSHTPFFTRDSFSRIAQSFDQPGGKVSIPDLVGNIIEFQLTAEDSHLQCPDLAPDIELAITKPCLSYRTVQRLLQGLPYGFDSLSYLPVTVHFQTNRRNKHTKEIIPPWKNIPDHDEVAARFEAVRQEWQASEHCVRLSSILNKYSSKIPPGINKIVAFACCSMAFPGDIKPASAFQHALVLYLRDFLPALQDDKAQEIKCFAQAPIYQDADKSVLEQAGISVLDDPRGFIEVDESSVILSISPDAPVRQIVTDLARPAIMIWERVIEETIFMTDPVSSRVREMVRTEYLEVEFPYEENFGDLCIYIRKN